jgi:2-polyprenyl-6-hydroxyphenyl methylase/3-demethylubiquinone-9 3-methyltransferase
VNASTAPSIDPSEIEQFSALAAEWWDPRGPFKPLHEFNPVRIGFIRDEVCARLGRVATDPKPLTGLDIADIGCGGGLLCEPIARLGAQITGVDPSDKNISVASLHAHQMGLEVNYVQTSVEDLAETGQTFDVVLAMEVLEHVADISVFMQACTKILKPGGIFVGATLNRTLKSLALAKIGVEYILRWLPVGTHDWKKFLTPAETNRALRDAGLDLQTIQGVTYNPLKGEWRISADTDINYMVVAVRQG